MRRPLLFMRKRSLLGSIIGRHAGIPPLSRSAGSAHDKTIGLGKIKAVSGWTGLENCS